ncbi:BACON domain-containing protein [Thalassotalea profundi]|uniref:BACON domain-containing protein n=1 Tax=Thalassotalea profundi TaxID=2036687 RepID=A0ABQ3IMX5_9GAMM|nr:BACON domain-containing protein [Thalassotalea profundi]GHE87145.1 hypothetical protein GCM10011501_15590 [Thalassotalea profundi]
MKEQLNHLYRFFILIILAITLQACGSDTPDPKAGFSISADTSRINFTHEVNEESSQSFSVSVNYTGNGLLLGYAPDIQAVPWLKFYTENVSDTSATVIVELSNIENYPADFYQTTIRLSTGDANSAALVHHDIDVSLLISNLLSFSATLGESEVSAQTLDLSLDSADWTFSSDVDWLTVEALTTEGITTLTVVPNLSEFTQAGLYQGNITITENSSGDIDTIPVELGIDNLYLVPSKTTISFTKTLNIQSLEQTVKISTNSIDAVNWQANSNQPWLIINKLTADSLHISVDPSIIPTDELSSAIVSINAIDNPFVINAEIPVSLYFSELETKNTIIEETTLNNNALISAIDKPYFYTSVDNELRTYHQYTGELIETLTVSPSDSVLEQLILHPNGKILLAKADVTVTNEDESTTTTTHRYKINLDNNSAIELSETTIEYEPLKFVSFAGRHFVVTQTLEFANENLERLFWDTENITAISNVDQASETEALYVIDASNSTFKRITARVNDFTTSRIIPEISAEYRPESLPENEVIASFIVSDDETSLFMINDTTEWITFDGENYTDKGLLTQAENSTALAVNKDNRGNIAFTRFDPAAGMGMVVDIYNLQGERKNTIVTGGQVSQATAITHDNKKIVLQTNTQVELINLDNIAISDANLEFTSTFGDTTINEQTITLENISENWQATSNASWLILTPNLQDEDISLTVEIDTAQISNWGLFTGVISILDLDSGDNIQVVVTLAIDEVRLFANYPALAFDQQADRSLLTQTVTVQTNKVSNIPWQATTNSSWITLNENLNDNTLTVTVDPNMVTNNGTHYGEIILSPTSIDESLSGKISVSFTKGDYDSTQQSEISIEGVTPNTLGVTLDPLRPYIYVAQLDKIDVYNLIDGNKVTSISSPLANIELTNLVIHPDGSIMLASNVETYLDDEGVEQTKVNHYQIDLTDFSISQLDSELIDLSYRPNKIIVVDGKAIVVSQAMEYANMALEVQFWDTSNAFLTTTMHKVPNKNSLLAYNGNITSIIDNDISINVFAEKMINATTVAAYTNINFLTYGLPNITTSTDGTQLYTANLGSEWATLTNEAYSDNGVLPSFQTVSTITVVTDSADNSYVYRKSFINGYGEAHTLTQYDSQQQQLDYSAYTSGSNNAFISPTYHRLIHFVDDKLVMDFMQ